ncbi:MAG: hypothetical protein ACP5N7_07290 [Candidatus Pacearchaeota archaeon]
MEIRSKITLCLDEFETITLQADSLIEKLAKNKLKKEERELLECAVNIIYELRKNLE